MNDNNRLHLGCGNLTPEEWINLDGSWNAKVAKYPLIRKLLGSLNILTEKQTSIAWSGNVIIHDVRQGLPFPENSLSAIYASHLLEHLHYGEAKALLKESYRVLQPGGIIRLVVPDLYTIVNKYLEERSSAESRPLTAADRLCSRLNMRPMHPIKGNILYRIYTSIKDLHSHKWMYDLDSLTCLVQEAGFANVEERAFLDSRISRIEDVEREDRLTGGICVEGIKNALLQ